METRERTNLFIGLVGLGALLLFGIIGYELGERQAYRGEHGEMRQAMHDRMEKRTDDHKDNEEGGHSMSMEAMTETLKNLKGEAFERAFLQLMIVHHQGAIEMAELVPENAQHEELKKLGQDIISAQNREIEMMRAWQKQWGYADGDEPGEATEEQYEGMGGGPEMQH